MHKDELIQLHTLMCQLKDWFERRTALGHGTMFVEYEQNGVLPQHVHKSKLLHKQAVFLLGKELANAIGPNGDFSEAQRVGVRLEALARKSNGVRNGVTSGPIEATAPS